MLATVLDAMILVWLVGTWFYEGHHKRCRVAVKCSSCGTEHDTDCSADRRA